MPVFCLMILIGISRKCETFEISSSRVTFLTSSRLAFSKKNLQPELSSFILKTLGCFSKVLIVFTIGSSYFWKLHSFSVKLGFTVFQKGLLSVILFTLRLLSKFLFVFLIRLARKFLCLLYVNSLRTEFSFLDLLKRRVRTIIAFRTLLLIKGAWLGLIYFSFK